jgi:hypothetical protein
VAHLLEAPEIPASEKFGKVMEALFIEGGIRQHHRVYQENIQVGGQSVWPTCFAWDGSALLSDPGQNRLGVL